MNESLSRAQTATETDPTWKRGWCTAKEVLKSQGNSCAQLKRENDQANETALRERIIQDKIQTSSSFADVRFKENAFLIDRNGDGHFKSLQEAFDKCNYIQNISFLLQPDEYDIFKTWSIRNRQVDVIGNRKPRLNKKGFLDDDPQIKINCKYDAKP